MANMYEILFGLDHQTESVTPEQLILDIAATGGNTIYQELEVAVLASNTVTLEEEDQVVVIEDEYLVILEDD